MEPAPKAPRWQAPPMAGQQQPPTMLAQRWQQPPPPPPPRSFPPPPPPRSSFQPQMMQPQYGYNQQQQQPYRAMARSGYGNQFGAVPAVGYQQPQLQYPPQQGYLGGGPGVRDGSSAGSSYPPLSGSVQQPNQHIRFGQQPHQARQPPPQQQGHSFNRQGGSRPQQSGQQGRANLTNLRAQLLSTLQRQRRQN